MKKTYYWITRDDINSTIVHSNKRVINKIIKNKYCLKPNIYTIEADSLLEAQERSLIMKNWYDETGVKTHESWEEYRRRIDSKKLNCK